MCSDEAKFSRNEPQPEEQASFTTMLVIMPCIQPDGFHILPPMSNRKVAPGTYCSAAPGMGYGLHRMALSPERLRKQHFTISGGSGRQNVQRCPGGPVAVPQRDQRCWATLSGLPWFGA